MHVRGRKESAIPLDPVVSFRGPIDRPGGRAIGCASASEADGAANNPTFSSSRPRGGRALMPTGPAGHKMEDRPMPKGIHPEVVGWRPRDSRQPEASTMDASFRHAVGLAAIVLGVGCVTPSVLWADTVTLAGPLTGLHQFYGQDVRIYNPTGSVLVTGSTTILVYDGSITVDSIILAPVANGADGSDGSQSEEPTPGLPGSSGLAIKLRTVYVGEYSPSASGGININASIRMPGGNGGRGGHGRSGSLVPECSWSPPQDGANGGNGGSGGAITIEGYGNVRLSPYVALSSVGGSGGAGGSGGTNSGDWMPDPGQFPAGHGAYGGTAGAGGGIAVSSTYPTEPEFDVTIGAGCELRADGGRGGDGGSGGSGMPGGHARLAQPGGVGGAITVSSVGNIYIDEGTIISSIGGDSGRGGYGGDGLGSGCSASDICANEYPDGAQWVTGQGGLGGSGNLTSPDGGAVTIYAGGLYADLYASHIFTSGGAGGDAGDPGTAGVEYRCTGGLWGYALRPGEFGGGGGSAGTITISASWGTGIVSCSIVAEGGRGGHGSSVSGHTFFQPGGPQNSGSGQAGGFGNGGGRGGTVQISAGTVVSVAGATLDLDGGPGGLGGHGKHWCPSLGTGGAGGIGGGAGAVLFTTPRILGSHSLSNVNGATGTTGNPNGTANLPCPP